MTLRRTVALAAAFASIGVGAADARVHRLRVPPPPGPAISLLPKSLAVDEREWSLRPSQRVVAAGTVRIRAYNRGMDDHDVAITDAAGTMHRYDLAPGATTAFDVVLTPGRYKIYCSLFAGTPSSHELFGMVTEITAR